MKLINVKYITGLFCIITVGFCKQAGAQTISPDSIRVILDAHNRYRSELSIPPLTWSDNLAQYAKLWVNELVNNRDCNMQHRPYDENDPWAQKYGENIYSGGGTNWTPGVVEAVAAWGKEKSNFNFGTKSCNDGAVCGHYTQMIWKNTTEVGCAVGVCGDGNVIIVCNYNPSGNYNGEAPY